MESPPQNPCAFGCQIDPWHFRVPACEHHLCLLLLTGFDSRQTRAGTHSGCAVPSQRLLRGPFPPSFHSWWSLRCRLLGWKQIQKWWIILRKWVRQVVCEVCALCGSGGSGALGRTSQFPYWFHCSNSCSGFPDTCLMIPDARIKKQSIGSVSQVCRTITRPPPHTHTPPSPITTHTYTHKNQSPNSGSSQSHLGGGNVSHNDTHEWPCCRKITSRSGSG